MEEELIHSLLPGGGAGGGAEGEPLEEEEELSAEEPSSKAANPAPEEEEEEEDEEAEPNALGDDAVMDWAEPLEELEGDEAEEESLAGESEWSESLAGSEKTSRRTRQVRAPRRKRSHPDEGWEEWPLLGEGWKRKEVVRQSGSSMGQKDVYYLSPVGERVRSRVELVSVLDGIVDLKAFDYKTGQFFFDGTPPRRVRHRVKQRRKRERSSSESSFMDREGAETPDSHHRSTPGLPPAKTAQVSQTTPPPKATPPTAEDKIRLPSFASSSKPLRLPSISGEFGSEDSTLVCFKCGISFTGTWYDRQRKKPCCPTCWASKSREHPMIRFRKWIPCGQCVGCHNTINCGQCANCKNGLGGAESRKRICRKRRCICPIRKAPGNPLGLKSYDDDNDDTNLSYRSDSPDAQLNLRGSDTENQSLTLDLGDDDDDDDDDDLSTDDDDDWHKKRKRRSCGDCKSCRCRKDCGTCDFCVDKPKFGGSNKKRQKCRLRQCQRQAMRHLLPFQMAHGDYRSEDPALPGRPRPHYTYSRKPKKDKDAPDNPDAPGAPDAPDDCDMEDDDSSFLPRNGLQSKLPPPCDYSGFQQQEPMISRWDKPKEEEEEEPVPMISQIFTLDNMAAGAAAATAPSGSESELMKLLQSLRTSALPILWYAIMAEGPQLQLIQCSKQSAMTDTTVLIEPGFFYQISVQKQPLLPTHPLYHSYPERLATVAQVVHLLLGLEKYVVCQGVTPKDPGAGKDPIILERAPTCDFLVKKNATICINCKTLQDR